MKKFLVLMLSFAMILTMCTACGKMEETQNETPKVLTDPEIKISENLPTFNMKGTYTPTENKLSGADETVLWTYEGDADSEYSYVAEFSWAASGKTLEEEAKADADEFYPEQELSISVTDCWHEVGEAENAYYCAYQEDAKGFVQSWIFQDGDKIYQVAAVTDGVEYTIDELNVTLVLPKTMEKLATPIEGAIACFKDAAGQFPDFNIYSMPLESEISAEALEERWGVNNVKIEEHKFLDIDNKEVIGGYKVSCDFEVDGTKLLGSENIIKSDDKYELYEFTRLADHLIGTSLDVEQRSMLYTVSPVE